MLHLCDLHFLPWRGNSVWPLRGGAALTSVIWKQCELAACVLCMVIMTNFCLWREDYCQRWRPGITFKPGHNPVSSYRPVNFQTPRIRRRDTYKSWTKAGEVNVWWPDGKGLQTHLFELTSLVDASEQKTWLSHCAAGAAPTDHVFSWPHVVALFHCNFSPRPA